MQSSFRSVSWLGLASPVRPIVVVDDAETGARRRCILPLPPVCTPRIRVAHSHAERSERASKRPPGFAVGGLPQRIPSPARRDSRGSNGCPLRELGRRFSRVSLAVIWIPLRFRVRQIKRLFKSCFGFG